MLTICLRILSTIGVILLTLLLLAMVSILLVLFFPVTYRIEGSKGTEGFRISGRVKWLFGLLRIRFDYPEPGELKAKAFVFTLFRMKLPPEKRKETSDKKPEDSRRDGKGSAKGRKSQRREDRAKGDRPEAGGRVQDEGSGENDGGNKNRREDAANANRIDGKETESALESGSRSDGNESGEPAAVGPAEKEETTSSSSVHDHGEREEEEGTSGQDISWFGNILQKFEKIKYTICSIYDKIKEIWNNISYYLELLQEEDTRQFIAHVRRRSGNMLKSVKPRHIRADIRFGTGAPDKTGYLYGAFCMAAPTLGKGLNVTPDFEQAVLEADFTISGHLIGGVLLWNLCRIVLDRRLRTLLRRIKPSGGAAPAKKTA